MNKTTIIVIGIIAAIIVVVGAFALFRPSSTPSSVSSSATGGVPSASGQGQFPQGSFLALGTSEGTVEVKIFIYQIQP
jgi:hypothetical protein